MTCIQATYTREGDTTVTTLDGSSLLLDVVNIKFTTGGLDHTDLVGLGIVRKKRLKAT